VRARSGDADAEEALKGFKRFPAWMWRNSAVLDFVGWLRAHNDSLVGEDRNGGFYGLDLYSLFTSLEAVVEYLDKVDPEAARRARQRYACFDHYGREAQSYGYMAGSGAGESCEGEVVRQLVELQQKAPDYAARDGRVAEDELFHAQQNARLATNAEAYYRSMFYGDVSSWNLRDQHMVETLDHLVQHLDSYGGRTKVVVWPHNSHLGDARAAEMGDRGELNLGQLVRERYGDDAVLVGFSTHSGTVTAASDWGAPAERKRVLPGLRGSYEDLFHRVGVPNFMLALRDNGEIAEALRERRLQRAIGVIYRPETERWSHYFYSDLPAQFDALLHFDVTRAVEPLERTSGWERGELPDNFPFAA
jgi:erythromycin esterase-like protein